MIPFPKKIPPLPKEKSKLHKEVCSKIETLDELLDKGYSLKEINKIMKNNASKDYLEIKII